MTDSEEVQNAPEETKPHQVSDEEANTQTPQNGNKEAHEEGEHEENGDDTDAPTPIGVIPDVSNLTLKHPLQNTWTLWYDNPGKRTNTNSWADYLKKVTTFDTVEDFWRIFNNIKPASNLPPGSNYHLFKEGIEPKWEDSQNSKGGKWIFNIPNNKNRKDYVDQAWLYAILSCIGEAYESTDDVCGVVVSLRKAQDRIALWTRDWRNEPVVRALGRQLKVSLELPDNLTIGYLNHEDSSKSRTAKNRYEV